MDSVIVAMFCTLSKIGESRNHCCSGRLSAEAQGSVQPSSFQKALDLADADVAAALNILGGKANSYDRRRRVLGRLGGRSIADESPAARGESCRN